MKNCYNLIKNSNIKKLYSSYKFYNIPNSIINIKILKKVFNNVVSKINNVSIVNITIPKNQFFLNFFNGIIYNYSTGMIIKSLRLESRSLRRIKPGFYLFFSFFLKKFKNLSEIKTTVVVLKNLNKVNLVKNFLLKFFLKKKTILVLKTSKNTNFKNYKKISYINKRLRRKFPIE